MPHLKIETNLPVTKIPEDFFSKAAETIAKALGKPASYCFVTVRPDILMFFGGNKDPCAITNLMSIGKLGPEENKKLSKVIGELVQKELGIPPNRMFITFQDEPSSNVGFDLTTFQEIFG